MSKDFERVGEIDVDAGIVMVGDPCYHLHKAPEDRRAFGKDWHDFIKSLVDGVYSPDRTAVSNIENGAALVIGGFGGDGRYPVYVRRENGLIAEVSIRFDGGEDGE